MSYDEGVRLVRRDESGFAVEPFSMDVRDGVLWIVWIRGTSVDDADARALIDRSRTLTAGIRPPVLVELNGMVTLTRNALLLFAKELSIAVMALVGPSPVDRVIATHFIEVHHPPYPTRYFPCRDEALTWLSGSSHIG